MTFDDEARLPWDKREDETNKAFLAFCVYRDMGPGRSFLKAYQAVKGPEKRHVTGTWKDWASQNEWKKRAQEFDIHLELLARRDREAEHHKELEAYRERQKKLAQATTASALQMLSLANTKIADLKKNYDDWKKKLAEAKSDEERAELLKNDPINLLSLPNWLSAASRVAQVATDAESQALAVNELLHVLKDTNKQ